MYVTTCMVRVSAKKKFSSHPEREISDSRNVSYAPSAKAIIGKVPKISPLHFGHLKDSMNHSKIWTNSFYT